MIDGRMLMILKTAKVKLITLMQREMYALKRGKKQ